MSTKSVYSDYNLQFQECGTKNVLLPDGEVGKEEVTKTCISIPAATWQEP